MKKCNKCLEVKSFAEFFKDKNHSTGHYSICKDCKKQSTYKWRSENPHKYNSSMREYRKNNKELFRNLQLKKNYGITLVEYNQILEKQDFRCWICKKINRSSKRDFPMDHNHKTGKPRGILCYGCNRSLHTLETKNLLEKALLYLDAFK